MNDNSQLHTLGDKQPELKQVPQRKVPIAQLFVFCVILLMADWVPAAPPITALALAPDGQQYVAGAQSGISVHQLSDRSLVRKIAANMDQVHDLAFSPDGRSLLVAGGQPAEAGIVELFAWPSGELKERYKISDDLLYRIRWSTDAQAFATCAHDHSCYLTRVDGREVGKYTSHSRTVLAIAFLPGDRQLISAGVDQTIQLWSDSGARLRTLNNHTATVTDLALRRSSADAILRCVSTSEDRTVRLWQPEIGRMVKFVRLESIPRRVAWASDGRLVVGTDDGMLAVIDAEEMKVIRSALTKISPIYEVVVTEAGMLVGGQGGVDFVSQ